MPNGDPKPVAKLDELLCGAVQVASGIIRPDRLLRWLRSVQPDKAGPDTPRMLTLMLFWFEMEESGKVSEEWLRKQLGYYILGHTNTKLSGLEFDADGRRVN